MTREIDRRDFLKLVGLGGVVFASQLRGWAQAAEKAAGSGPWIRRVLLRPDVRLPLGFRRAA